MPAIDALSIRTRVQEQLDGHTFRTIIDAFVSDVDTKKSVNDPQVAFDFRSEVFANAMSIAETYYLSPEMHDLCQEASQAEDFPSDETIMREDPPSEAGFLYLPARFRIVELRGRLVVAHAIVWINNKVFWLCDRLDPDDEMNAILNQTFGSQTGLPRYDLMTISKFRWNEPMPKVMTFEKGVLPTNAHVEFQHMPNGEVVMMTDAQVHPAMSSPTETVSPELRFLLTVWRMMQQTLASVDREEIKNKATNRYADKAGIIDKSVHVIQLRRREAKATGTGEPINYRYLRRGHWRRVWCGPIDKPEQRYKRAVYIHPRICGPEGAPLINREKINALVR